MTNSQSPKPFRFGVQVRKASSRAEWIELARRIEDRGYTNLTIPDHFDDQLCPAIALMAAADATEMLRIGTLVYCNDYRHPVALAKEAATLDLLSEGRLELGLGAGWMLSDYEQAGLTYDKPGVRIDRMLETLEIIKGLFSEGDFSYQGKHYQIDSLDGTPKPCQKPHPPILIGGGGPRFLRLAGQHGDIVGVNPNLSSGVLDTNIGSDATAERYLEKLKWVAEGAAGRFDQIELQIRIFFVAITDDRASMAADLAGGFGLTGDQALESPLALCGTVDQIVETVQQRRQEYGFNYLVVGEDQFEDFAPVVAQLAGT